MKNHHDNGDGFDARADRIRKKARRRAVQERRRQAAATGRPLPLQDCLNRVGDDPHGRGGFDCQNCGTFVSFGGAGSAHRNHCPDCLHSKHVDDSPGDRAADCGGTMEPIAVWARTNGEWALVHRCRECGALSSNRVLADDSALVLVALAVRPLASPPFPLAGLVR
ncbi:MAG: RNHCP domain-containing protein [Fimbriimonadaceae bacterium]|nr:RNHCP domain-containing protein [Fimbriimonadaceae bacterium]